MVNPYESPLTPPEPTPLAPPPRENGLFLAIFWIGFVIVLGYSLVSEAIAGFKGTWFQVLTWFPRLLLTLLMAGVSYVLIVRASRNRWTRSEP
jgi:hypothetical protein